MPPLPFSVNEADRFPDLLSWKKISTPFGAALALWSQDSLFCLHFLNGTTPKDALRALAPPTQRQETRAAPAWVDTLFDPKTRFKICLVGTAFQKKVWRALLTIPAGQVCSYGALARKIGAPQAARAVGMALGANPVPFFIPCHRVIAGDGSLGGFSAGLPLKRRLLKAEGIVFSYGKR